MTPKAPVHAPRPITHARIWRIAGPMVLSNATVPLVALVDTAVVGQTGLAAPIGAVAVGGALLTAFYWLFGFLRMGTTGLAAQAFGAGDDTEATATLSRALLIGGAAGLLMILLQGVILNFALSVSTASEEVLALAAEYVRIRIWSAPALIATYGLTGWLIAAERTRGVLVSQIAMNGVNMALDLWFVLGLGWGVGGVAFATVLAECTGLAVCLWYCRDAFAGTAWRDPALVFDPLRLWRMAAVNRDILLRSVMLLAVMQSFIFYFSPLFGDVTLAANQILMQFIAISAFALDGFAFAAEGLVGNAVGRRDPARLRRAALMCGFWCGAMGVAMALVFAVAGGAIIDLMTTSAPVRAEARLWLPWMLACPVLGFAAWMLDGVFIGATRGADMRNMTAIAAVIYFLAALILIPAFGNPGLWAALLISYVARAVTLAARYPALERSVAV